MGLLINVLAVMPMIMRMGMFMAIKRQCAFGAGAKQGAMFRGRSDKLGRAFTTDVSVQA